MIGVNNSSVRDESMEHISFPNMDYAAFEAKGKLPVSIQELVPKLSEFVKNSNLEYGDGPELEVYPPGDMDSDEYICYYWVPVK
jgi:AraC family transcriptional regulator